MQQRANGWSSIYVCRSPVVAVSPCRGAAQTLHQTRHRDAVPWLQLPALLLPGLRNHFSQSWRIYARTESALQALPKNASCRHNKSRLEKNVKTARAIILAIAVNTLSFVVAEAQSPNVTGSWNIEITFANQQHRSLRLDAQSGGKGSLTVTDAQSKVWLGTKPSEAKWTRDEGDSVTFSGPVEFRRGNVGRDAGILKCNGKFETPNLSTGEADFSPSVGDRPSKSGTFKAVRASG